MVERAEAIETVLAELRTGAPEYNAAQKAGITFATLWNWKQEIPGLKERIEEAKRSRIILWEDALHKQALKGSVTAILALLEKNDQGWRNRAKDIAPKHNTLILNGGVGQMISMLSPEKKQKLLGAMHVAGLLPDHVIDIKASENGHLNGNGASNGNGKH